MNFKLWLEGTESERTFWEEFFLAAWRLNKKTGGLAVTLAGLDPQAITNTSAFQQKLGPPQQQNIINRINQGSGNVGDLVDIAANPQEAMP